MSTQSPVDVVKASISTFMRGDVDGVIAGLTEDVVWEGPADPALPYAGEFRGRESARRFFVGLSQVEIASFESLEYLPSGDKVTVVGRWGVRCERPGSHSRVRG
jgi:ketosteroid isomerase-like protein